LLAKAVSRMSVFYRGATVTPQPGGTVGGTVRWPVHTPAQNPQRLLLTLPVRQRIFTGIMAGIFGVISGSKREAPPPETLLETYPRLDVHALYRSGALTEGVETELKLPDGGSLRARQKAGNFVSGTRRSWSGPIPLWGGCQSLSVHCVPPIALSCTSLAESGRAGSVKSAVMASTMQAATRNALSLAGAA
jgi:hypothetical protein